MKILLIDDHKLFSQSIKLILELSEAIERVDLMDDFSSVLNFPYDDYDILLIDINLTSLYQEDGLSLAQMIIENGCSAKIVILTGYSKKMYEYRAKIMGTWGFLDKSIAPGELLQNLVGIYQGRKIFSDEVVVDVLTSREIEILELVRNGLSILGVSSRQEAIHVAEQLGYFSPE